MRKMLLYVLVTIFSMTLSFLHYSIFVIMTEGRMTKYHFGNPVHFFDWAGKAIAIVIMIFVMFAIVRSDQGKVIKIIQSGYLFWVAVSLFTGFIHWLISGQGGNFSVSVESKILTIRGVFSYVLIFIPAYIFTFFINSYFVKKNNNEGVEIAPNFSEEKDGD